MYRYRMDVSSDGPIPVRFRHIMRCLREHIKTWLGTVSKDSISIVFRQQIARYEAHDNSETWINFNFSMDK